MKAVTGFRRARIPLPSRKIASIGEHGVLHRTVHELARAAGIPSPRVCITNSPGCNAFTAGGNPSRATVTVTQGLLQRLSGREVRAVLAHELAHIKNGDTSLSRTLVTGCGAIASHLAWAGFLTAELGWRRGRILSCVVGTLAGLIALTIAVLIQRFIVQRGELLADEEGARLAGDSLALRGALENLGSQGVRAAPMDGMGPGLFPRGFSGKSWTLEGLLSSHPSTEEHVRRLQG